MGAYSRIFAVMVASFDINGHIFSDDSERSRLIATLQWAVMYMMISWKDLVFEDFPPQSILPDI